MSIDTQFDYVIVGAGTAGCVLAARLSEDRHTRVCLIEAGGPARHPFIHVPALVGAAIAHRGLTWGLSTEPQSGARTTVGIPLPRGRVIGGSGSINGMAYHRGHPQGLRRLGGRRQHRLELAGGAAVLSTARKTMPTGATSTSTASTDPSTSRSFRSPIA